jgi:hypothetical protein
MSAGGSIEAFGAETRPGRFFKTSAMALTSAAARGTDGLARVREGPLDEVTANALEIKIDVHLATRGPQPG